MAALLPSLLALMLFASQPPAPGAGERESGPPQEQAETVQQRPEPDQRGTEASPVVVKVQPPANAEADAARDEEERKDEASARWWNVAFTGALVLVGLGTGIVVGWQAFETRRAAAAARLSAEASWIAQRPFVSISHKPPGLDIADELSLGTQGKPYTYTVEGQFKVENSGSTPAHVTRLLVQQPRLWSGDLPERPPYDESEAAAMQITLAKGDAFVQSKKWEVEEAVLAKTTSFKNTIVGRPNKLLMLGYVEYVDQRGTIRRTGYGRMYDQDVDRNRPTKIVLPDSGKETIRVYDKEAWEKRNNLPYITQAGYNYDVEIDDKGNPKKAT